LNKCESHKDIIDRIEKLETKDEKKEKRITKLETRASAYDEKFDRIMSTLSEIKDEMHQISELITSIFKRPGELMWKVLAALIIAAIVFALGWR
jgi:predicted nuclease with TOPRIM domain